MSVTPNTKVNNSGVTAMKNENEESYCSLYIAGSPVSAYDDDENVFLRGGGADGLLVVYVNDSPVLMHAAGSKVFPIYPFLSPGKTRFASKGSTSVGFS